MRILFFSAEGFIEEVEVVKLVIMNFKKFGILDLALTKFSVACAVLFLVAASNRFAIWAANTHWIWFLLLALGAAVRPVMTVFKR